MIEGIAYELLECIKSQCEGKYTILSKSWLKEIIGVKSPETINDNLKYLSERGYVSVRYEDDNEVCLIPLSKSYEESLNIRPTKSPFLPAMTGAIIGGLISGVATILVILFSGVV